MNKLFPIYIAILCIVTVTIAISINKKQKPFSELPKREKNLIVLLLIIAFIVLAGIVSNLFF